VLRSTRLPRGHGGAGLTLQAGGIGLVVGDRPRQEAQQGRGVAVPGALQDHEQVLALGDVLGAAAQDGGERRLGLR
jgi:hypothetical protein